MSKFLIINLLDAEFPKGTLFSTPKSRALCASSEEAQAQKQTQRLKNTRVSPVYFYKKSQAKKSSVPSSPLLLFHKI
jgi:hypothetical protein